VNWRINRFSICKVVQASFTFQGSDHFYESKFSSFEFDMICRAAQWSLVVVELTIVGQLKYVKGLLLMIVPLVTQLAQYLVQNLSTFQ